MSVRTRKLLALFLIGWLLVLANGYASALASETQHDLEWTHSDVPGKAPQACDHGCIGHLAAHIVAIEQAAPVACSDRQSGSPFVHPDAGAPRWHSEPFSPPPNSLA